MLSWMPIGTGLAGTERSGQQPTQTPTGSHLGNGSSPRQNFKLLSLLSGIPWPASLGALPPRRHRRLDVLRLAEGREHPRLGGTGGVLADWAIEKKRRLPLYMPNRPMNVCSQVQNRRNADIAKPSRMPPGRHKREYFAARYGALVVQ